jgi:DNA-directed RNA polymerase specialized sigma24 family protein
VLSLVRTKPRTRVAATSRDSSSEAWTAPLNASNRRLIAQALARRAARERLMLALLLYERMRPIEVADALGLSPRQVERTYDSMIDQLRRAVARRSRRALASRGRTTPSNARLRKAA